MKKQVSCHWDTSIVGMYACLDGHFEVFLCMINVTCWKGFVVGQQWLNEHFCTLRSDSDWLRSTDICQMCPSFAHDKITCVFRQTATYVTTPSSPMVSREGHLENRHVMFSIETMFRFHANVGRLSEPGLNTKHYMSISQATLSRHHWTFSTVDSPPTVRPSP